MRTLNILGALGLTLAGLFVGWALITGAEEDKAAVAGPADPRAATR
jgi:hypothetical protein